MKLVYRHQSLAVWMAWGLALIFVPVLSANGRSLQHWVFARFDMTWIKVAMALALGVLVLLALNWLWRKVNDIGWRPVLLVGLILGLAFAIVVGSLHRVEEQMHFITFGVLGFLTAKLFSWPTAIVIMLGISVGDEVFQAWLPDRVGDWRDVVMNSIASLLGLMVAWIGQKRNLN